MLLHKTIRGLAITVKYVTITANALQVHFKPNTHKLPVIIIATTFTQNVQSVALNRQNQNKNTPTIQAQANAPSVVIVAPTQTYHLNISTIRILSIQ